MLFDIAEKATRQLTLAEACAPPAVLRQRALMETMDKINDKHGKGSLRFAAQGSRNAFWHMQRNLMSPHYTTQWGDLLSIKAQGDIDRKSQTT